MTSTPDFAALPVKDQFAILQLTREALARNATPTMYRVALCDVCLSLNVWISDATARHFATRCA